MKRWKNTQLGSRSRRFISAAITTGFRWIIANILAKTSSSLSSPHVGSGRWWFVIGSTSRVIILIVYCRCQGPTIGTGWWRPPNTTACAKNEEDGYLCRQQRPMMSRKDRCVIKSERWNRFAIMRGRSIIDEGKKCTQWSRSKKNHHCTYECVGDS